MLTFTKLTFKLDDMFFSSKVLSSQLYAPFFNPINSELDQTKCWCFGYREKTEKAEAAEVLIKLPVLHFGQLGGMGRCLIMDSLRFTLLPRTAPHYTVLHCPVLHCTALYCTAPHCTALHCTALHCTVLHCTALHCTALHCTALYFTAPYCTTLHFNEPHWNALHCTALYCNALYFVALQKIALYSTKQ